MKQLEFVGLQMTTNSGNCDIAPVGKRRDGGTRYWCLAHKADATAKYGRRAVVCRAAHLPPILPEEILELDLDEYTGGIALWGAVPPIYDTTRLPLDFGIHVHARKIAGGDKNIDQTYRGVKLKGSRLPTEGLMVSEVDAVYFMVSSVFGFNTRFISCTFCGYPHLDKDWFSIHPHRRHLCAGCGKNFHDTAIGVGNPIRATQDALGLLPQKRRGRERRFHFDSPTFLAAYRSGALIPQSFGPLRCPKKKAFTCTPSSATAKFPIVTILIPVSRLMDSNLDPIMVRTLMAQKSLPHLLGRVISLRCDLCGHMEFSADEMAFTPVVERQCSKCHGRLKGATRLRRTIANPLLASLERTSENAPRPPQQHVTNLLSETL